MELGGRNLFLRVCIVINCKLCALFIRILMVLFREDHLLISWHLEGGIAHPSVVTEFPDDFYPTDMHWHPRPNYGVLITKKQSLDVLLITTADGICLTLTRTVFVISPSRYYY